SLRRRAAQCPAREAGDAERDDREHAADLAAPGVQALPARGGVDRARHHAALEVGQALVVERFDRDPAGELHGASALSNRTTSPGAMNSRSTGSAAAAAATRLRARHTRSLVAVTDEPISS